MKMQLTKEKTEIKVGDVVTEHLWSDRHVHDVLKVTANTVTIRQRTPVVDKKPVFQVGGFCAIVIENGTWHTEPNPEGRVSRAHLRKDGCFYTDMGAPLTVGDHYFYDRAF